MIAVDSNILIYAHRPESPFHAAAAKKLTELAEHGATWAIPWPCVHEFLAFVTSPRIYKPPTPVAIALEFVAELCRSPSLTLLAETDLHWNALRSIVAEGEITGGRIHDARIAAICMQHGVREIWSADRDFSRFGELSVVNPLLS